MERNKKGRRPGIIALAGS